MDNKDKIELAEWVSKQALQNGAEQATVKVSKSRSVDGTFRDGKIENLQESTQNSINLNIYVQHKYSGHSTCILQKGSLEKFIKQAVASTKYLTADEFRSLPDPGLYPSDTDTDLNVFDQQQAGIETSERVKIATEIEAAAQAESNSIISVTSSYSDSVDESLLLQSNGFVGGSRSTYFEAGASVTVKDEKDGRPEDWFYASTRYFMDLPDKKFIGKLAAQRALKKIGQKKLQSGTYTMIVENRAAARLIYIFLQAMSARSIQQKSSFLDGMKDKKIASEKLTMIDDPLMKKGLSSRLFDYEGIAAKKRFMIENGVLRNYYVDNYYGKKTGMEQTSGSSSNLVFNNGSRSFDEILKDLKKGIIVNGFLGGNSNSTTGDFSLGIVGALVENGSIVHPVNEMNISGNAKDFWNQLVEVGSDPYPYSSIKIPAMVFEKVNFSGL
jgi:PmbA protein